MQELDPRVFSQVDTPDVILERQQKLEKAQEQVRLMREAAQSAQVTREAFQQWTDPQTGLTDYQRVIGQVNQHDPKTGEALQKFFDEHLEKTAQIEKQNWENRTAENAAVGSVASSIHDQASLDAWRKAAHPEIAAALPNLYDDAGKARIAQLVQASKNASVREQEAHNGFEEWMAMRNFDRGTPEFIDNATRKAASIFSNLTPDQGTDFLKAAPTLGFPPQAITPLFSKTAAEAADMALTPNERAVQANAAAGRAIQQTAQTETARHNQATESIARTNAALAQQREGRLEQAGPAGTNDDAKSIAAGIMNGDQPPTLTGLYRFAAPVRAELERNKYNLTRATEDWQATTKYLNTLNGAQQIRLRQAVNFAHESVPLIRELVNQWDGSGLPLLSKANLEAAASGAYGNKQQSLAVRLKAQIADMQSELGTVYKGGNSSTDESLRLASENLKGEWSKKAALDALDQIERNLTIRDNSIKVTGAVGGRQANPYAPEGTGAAAAPTQKATTGPKEGTEAPVPGHPGVIAVYRGGRWIVK